MKLEDIIQELEIRAKAIRELQFSSNSSGLRAHLQMKAEILEEAVDILRANEKQK